MNNGKIGSFRDLDVWKKGMTIAEQIYQFTTQLPQQEQYGLVVQMRRAAVSMPTNIAEGFRRRNGREFRQFLHVAFGSSAEVQTQVELCRCLHDVDLKSVDSLVESIDHFQAMTMSLIKSIQVLRDT